MTEPQPITFRVAPLPGRNDPCPCGSGERFKQCCGRAGMPLAEAGHRPFDSIVGAIRALDAAGNRDEALRQLKCAHVLAPGHVPTLERAHART